MVWGINKFEGRLEQELSGGEKVRRLARKFTKQRLLKKLTDKEDWYRVEKDRSRDSWESPLKRLRPQLRPKRPTNIK